MASALTPTEEAQLLQTIEMFEVITQSQPMDYQSLEILKEAYSKLAREKDVVGTSKRIAQAYVQLGQLSSAILEYESILQRYPGDPDVQKALADIENRANSLTAPAIPDAALASPAPATATAAAPAKASGNGKPASRADIDDGKHSMHKIFVEGKLVSPSDFEAHWPKPSLDGGLSAPSESFLASVADRQLLPMEKGLRTLIEKTRLGFIPIDRYDVDIETTRAFPRDVCLRWGVLPYDKMSKSVFVATSNPYNKQALRELEAATKQRIVFFLANPVEINKTLKKIFR